MARHSLLLDEFRALLPMVDVVSFDVFDTLFVRLLDQPEGLFALLGQHLAQPNFLTQRIEAQALGFQAMREEGRGEITLDDIYANLPHPRFDSQSLAQMEQGLEHALIRLNPEVAELFGEARDAGKILALTSDMYLPLDFFQSIAQRFDVEPDHYFISSHCNSTKRDHGALFDQLKQRTGVEGSRILHVGDNPLGDIRRAHEKGLHTLHYHPPRANHAPIAPGEVSAQLCAGLTRYIHYQPQQDSWFALGWQYGGPILQGFLDWIHEQAVVDRIDRILFVSRDGYLLDQFHRRYPHCDIQGLYLRGSRVAFSLAALDERNFLESVPFLLSGADNITLQNLFERIAVELPDDTVLNDLGLQPHMRIDDETRREIAQFLIAMRHRILQVAREARRGLHQHLLELGLYDGMRVAFVDVGWSGTTQSAFQRALKDMLSIEVQGYYLGLSEPAASLSRKTGLHMKAMSESALLDRTQMAKLYENRAVAELFFSAPHPTTIGYRVDQGRLDFLGDTERGVDYDLSAIVEAINQGISQYVETAEQLLRPLAVPVERQLPMKNLLQLVAQPTVEQASLIGALYNWDAWASTENHRIYFAGRPQSRRGLHFKPDLWPAGWSVIQHAGPDTPATKDLLHRLQETHDQ